MALQDNIKAERIKRGITMEELADSIGTTKQLIYKYENGMCQPNATVAVSIAERLGTTVEKLVKGE